MSLEIVRQVSRENPDLLATNLGRTCYRHTSLLIDKLRAAGHEAYFVCKSPGEGQYTPPGFQGQPVTGLDGKEYQCSGVSHDAIWCDGKQFDTLGSANEHDRPIYKKQTEPFWSFESSDGPQIVASPTWNAVPQQDWRANNPPLKDAGTPNPVPQPPVPPQTLKLPDYAQLGDDPFFVGKVGAFVAEEMGTPKCNNCGSNDIAGGMNAGSASWIARTVHSIMVAFVKHRDHREADAIALKHRNEMRAVLHRPPLG